MVCLSEYLPLRSVYILVIKVEGFVSQRDHESPSFFFKCHLGPPVDPQCNQLSKHEINCYIYIDILNDSSLVVSFSNISAYFA